MLEHIIYVYVYVKERPFIDWNFIAAYIVKALFGKAQNTVQLQVQYPLAMYFDTKLRTLNQAVILVFIH